MTKRIAEKEKSSRKPKFPLSKFHRKDGTGYWCKKVRGRRIYFESLASDPKGTQSLATWFAQREALQQGKNPESELLSDLKSDGQFQLRDLINQWLNYNRRKLEASEITKRTYDEYHQICEVIVSVIPRDRDAQSIAKEDFAKLREKLALKYCPTGLQKRIVMVRSLFKFGFDQELLDRPIRYGRSFDTPSAKTLRKHRAEKGRLDFSQQEIAAMLANCTVNQKAMILLGINGGLGNSDVADLPLRAVDLEKGWLDYPRVKTGTERKIPLWPETIAAIKQVLRIRPKVDSQLLLISKRGNDYQDGEVRTGRGITGEFRQVLKRAGIEPRNRGFYSLRRTFQTQGELCNDIVAVKAIMGHVFDEQDMSARYRQVIADSRLQNVTSTVHAWLFPKTHSAKKPTKSKSPK